MTDTTTGIQVVGHTNTFDITKPVIPPARPMDSVLLAAIAADNLP